VVISISLGIKIGQQGLISFDIMVFSISPAQQTRSYSA